jgi:hypothetical protein
MTLVCGVRPRVLTIIRLCPGALSSPSKSFRGCATLQTRPKTVGVCAAVIQHSTQSCVTFVITLTSLIQFCITKTYLTFFIILLPSSDFNPHFLCVVDLALT